MTAKSPVEGCFKALPEDRRVLRHWYPGWAVLVEKLTATSLRAKDLKRILGLTYRQIYHWHTRKLIWDRRNSETEWRRFSIADIFGLALVKRVAELGIPFDRLQKSYAIGMSVPGFLWRALPYLVAGRDGYLYTDFENFCYFAIVGSDSASKTVEVRIDSESAGPIVVLPIKPIVKDLVGKLDLADFKVLVNEGGIYSFQINGVPLQLEDLCYTEKEIREVEQTQKTPPRVARKPK